MCNNNVEKLLKEEDSIGILEVLGWINNTNNSYTSDFMLSLLLMNVKNDKNNA